MTILLFVIILSVLVFVHELGHFWAARRFGVGVQEFGFGFPPRLWGRQHGQTLYSINLIPFGGFVRLEGEIDISQNSATSFAKAPLSKKFLILAAGVIMNYALAWVILSGSLMVGVDVDPAAAPASQQTYVRQVRSELFISAESQAAAAGLQTGDRLVSINGQTFASTEDLIAYTQAENRPALTIEVVRQNHLETFTVTPDPNATQSIYGLGIQSVGTLQYPWYLAPWHGLLMTGRFTAQTFIGFGGLLRDLVTQGRVSEDLAGPVGIAVLTGQISQLGILPVLQFVAILSISLAVINFLPLPALDGGRATFVVIEKLTGRPVNPKIEGVIHAAGFYLLIGLIILISIRDVQRFEIIERLMNAFR